MIPNVCDLLQSLDSTMILLQLSMETPMVGPYSNQMMYGGTMYSPGAAKFPAPCTLR